MTLIGSQDTGLGNVDTAGQDDGGGGVGTIDEIISSDGSITVTNPTGPIVDLTGAGTLKNIDSPDGSISVSSGTGPTAHIEVADKTAPLIAKFSGAIIASEGASSGFLADAGGDLSLGNSAQVDAQLYPTAARTFAVLRVTAVGGGDPSVAYTVTLYKNGAPTAQHVTVAAGTAAGTVLTDTGNPIAFAANDKFDLFCSSAASLSGSLALSAVLEGPGGGTSGAGIAGYSWLSTQLGRANALLPGGVPLLDSPWYTDLIVNPGQNNLNQGIEFSIGPVGTGGATPAPKPGGVYLLDTGTTANSTCDIGTPNSDSFILQNPLAGPFYVSSRCLIPSPGSGNAQAAHNMVFMVDGGNQEAIIFQIAFVAGVATYFLAMTTVAGGNVTLQSTAPVDLGNGHDYAVGFDGTTIAAYVDGVVVPDLSTTNLAGVSMNTLRMAARVENNAAAISVQMYADKLCVIQRSMQ
jgi:hypothetical protein